MRCAAIMTSDPLRLRDTLSVGDAARTLIAERQTSVPVVDSEDRYLGMFGTADLLGLLVPRVALAGSLAPNVRFVDDDPRALTARFEALKHRALGDVADRDVVVLAPDTPHIDAFRVFCRNPQSLPVVDPESGRLLGMVSYWDVVGQVTKDA